MKTILFMLCSLFGVFIDAYAHGGGGHYGGGGGHYGGGGGYHGHYGGGYYGGFYLGVPAYSYPYYNNLYYPPTVIPTPTVPPTYIQQSPPIVQQQNAANYWYHCDNPEGYYPYVKECLTNWQRVEPTPPPPR